MKKKIIAIGVGMLSMVGGAVGVAIAAPGDNGSNTHGLCTAYFNGSENGRAHKRQAKPFVALEGTAEAWTATTDTDGDGDVDAEDAREGAEAVFEYCNDSGKNPKGIGGNPDDPSTPGDDGNGKNGRGKG